MAKLRIVWTKTQIEKNLTGLLQKFMLLMNTNPGHMRECSLVLRCGHDADSVMDAAIAKVSAELLFDFSFIEIPNCHSYNYNNTPNGNWTLRYTIQQELRRRTKDPQVHFNYIMCALKQGRLTPGRLFGRTEYVEKELAYLLQTNDIANAATLAGCVDQYDRSALSDSLCVSLINKLEMPSTYVGWYEYFFKRVDRLTSLPQAMKFQWAQKYIEHRIEDSGAREYFQHLLNNQLPTQKTSSVVDIKSN